MFRPDFNANRSTILTDSWHITVNSNKAVTSQAVAIEIRDELRQSLRRIFEVFPEYLHPYLSRKYGGNRFNNPFDLTAEDVIIPGSVKVIPKFEIGGFNHRIHSHTLVQFQCEDRYIFQVDIAGLRQWIRDNIGPLHIDIKHIPNGTQNVLEYIFKNQDNNR